MTNYENVVLEKILLLLSLLEIKYVIISIFLIFKIDNLKI